jgi:hypothetical protein
MPPFQSKLAHFLLHCAVFQHTHSRVGVDAKHTRARDGCCHCIVTTLPARFAVGHDVVAHAAAHVEQLEARLAGKRRHFVAEGSFEGNPYLNEVPKCFVGNRSFEVSKSDAMDGKSAWFSSIFACWLCQMQTSFHRALCSKRGGEAKECTPRHTVPLASFVIAPFRPAVQASFTL